MAKQPSQGDFPACRPAGRCIGGDSALLPGAPERASNGRGAAEKTAGTGQRSGLVEHFRRIGFVLVPPAEELPGPVDRRVERYCPRGTKLCLIAQHRSSPLSSRPQHQNDNGEYDENLAEEIRREPGLTQINNEYIVYSRMH